MKHIMKLNESAFERMKNGVKKREYRFNDEKRKLVRIGDTIEFHNLSNLEEKIIVEVEDIELFNSLEEAIASHFESDFSERHKDIDSTITAFMKKGYWSQEEIKKYGMIIFTVKKTSDHSF